MQTSLGPVVHLTSETHPALFERLAGALSAVAPEELWAVGDVALLGAEHVRVVVAGARAASEDGEQIALKLARDLSVPCTVVTAGGYGIEAAALRGVLAAGGTPVVVLPGGVDRPFPSGHAELFSDVVAGGGLLVSASAPGTAPSRDRFLARNSMSAALADAVVVVEAGPRSGSVQLARTAREMGRPVGAVPGPVMSGLSVGTHQLIREGAALVAGADDVLLGMLGGETRG